jgi:predicted MPP superfamily phosphohydrolase
MDVAHDLGRPPRGSGRRQWMARLPGNEIFRVAFTELELRLPRLPAAWDGLTLWHLTDLHLCGLPDLPFYEAVLDRCAAAPADLVVFTGDLVDSDGHYNWITPLLARLRWREAALAILGNHDGWHDVPRITKAVEAAGFALIGGGWRRLTIRGEPLTVIGNEMPWLRPLPDLRDCPAEGLRLCLSHSPDQLPWARRHGIDLMLAGHNHGGQIRVPGFGPILCPSQYGRRYDGGLYHEPPTVLYVSRGLSGTYPLRYFCPPEVTRITLRRG